MSDNQYSLQQRLDKMFHRFYYLHLVLHNEKSLKTLEEFTVVVE